MNSGKFSIIRYVPNVIREEFINIGLLMHSFADKKAEFRIAANLKKRINSFDDEAEPALIDYALKGMRDDVIDMHKTLEGLQALSNQNFIDVFSIPFSNLIQFSDIRSININNFSDDFEGLFNTFVYYDKPKNDRINAEGVNKIMQRVFKASNVDNRISEKPKLTIEKIGQVRLDFSYQSLKSPSKTNYVKAFSFDHADNSAKTQEVSLAKEWAYNFGKIINQEKDLQIESIVFAPSPKVDLKAYDILDEFSKVVKLKSAGEVQEYASKISSELIGV